MRKRSFVFWLLLVALLATAAPTAADPVRLAVIVHPDTPVKKLSREQLEAIFTRSQRTWPGNRRIVPLNLRARTTVRVAFDRAVLLRDADEVARFWIDRRVRGGAPPPHQVRSAELMVACFRSPSSSARIST